jgi:hypothetical protein
LLKEIQTYLRPKIPPSLHRREKKRGKNGPFNKKSGPLLPVWAKSAQQISSMKSFIQKLVVSSSLMESFIQKNTLSLGAE